MHTSFLRTKIATRSRYVRLVCFVITVGWATTGPIFRPSSPLIETPKLPIEWLHIPKTGTSFGNTLILWACPDLEKTLWVNAGMVLAVPDECKAKFYIHPQSRKDWFIGDHTTLQNRTDDQLANVFTFIRSPKTKIASGFHYIAHVRKQSSTNATTHDICSLASTTALPHLALGAQVKIIGGEPMAGFPWFQLPSNESPTGAAIKRACDRLNLLAFVGITDFWTASICLFHKRFGGHPHAVEHINVRKGGYHSTGSIERADCNDHADEALFECARVRFFAELRAFPDCVRLLNGSSEVTV
jgi:hypothetical protein